MAADALASRARACSALKRPAAARLTPHRLAQADGQRDVVVAGLHAEFDLGLETVGRLAEEAALDILVNRALEERNPVRLAVTAERFLEILEIGHVRGAMQY